jgi:hypothetical protein
MVTMIMAMPVALAKDAGRLDAHQARRRRIVGGRAERAAERGAVEQLVQPDDHASAEPKVRAA